MDRPKLTSPEVAMAAAWKMANLLCTRDPANFKFIGDITTELFNAALKYPLIHDVEILDPDQRLEEFVCILYMEHRSAVTKWIQINNVSPQFKVGDVVKFNNRAGKITHVLFNTAQYLIAVNRSGSTKYRYVAWEDCHASDDAI